MIKRTGKSGAAALLLLGVFAAVEVLAQNSSSAPQEIALGWSSREPGLVGVDASVVHSGSGAGYIRITDASPVQHLYLNQSIRADRYHGSRIRLRGYLKYENAREGRGQTRLLLQIEGPDGSRVGRDQMDGREITGSTDWTRHDLVLDVPATAIIIFFGIEQSGPGQTWVDDLSLEVVDASVPTTQPNNGVGLAPERPADALAAIRASQNAVKLMMPVNLDFEQRLTKRP